MPVQRTALTRTAHAVLGSNDNKQSLRPLVIVVGNPGVFQAYPYPYLAKPLPTTRGKGFSGLG